MATEEETVQAILKEAQDAVGNWRAAKATGFRPVVRAKARSRPNAAHLEVLVMDAWKRAKAIPDPQTPAVPSPSSSSNDPSNPTPTTTASSSFTLTTTASSSTTTSARGRGITQPARGRATQTSRQSTPQPTRGATPQPSRNRTPQPARQQTPQPSFSTVPQSSRQPTPPPPRQTTPHPSTGGRGGRNTGIYLADVRRPSISSVTVSMTAVCYTRVAVSRYPGPRFLTANFLQEFHLSNEELWFLRLHEKIEPILGAGLGTFIGNASLRGFSIQQMLDEGLAKEAGLTYKMISNAMDNMPLGDGVQFPKYDRHLNPDPKRVSDLLLPLLEAGLQDHQIRRFEAEYGRYSHVFLQQSREAIRSFCTDKVYLPIKLTEQVLHQWQEHQHLVGNGVLPGEGSRSGTRTAGQGFGRSLVVVTPSDTRWYRRVLPLILAARERGYLAFYPQASTTLAAVQSLPIVPVEDVVRDMWERPADRKTRLAAEADVTAPHGDSSREEDGGDESEGDDGGGGGVTEAPAEKLQKLDRQGARRQNTPNVYRAKNGDLNSPVTFPLSSDPSFTNSRAPNQCGCGACGSLHHTNRDGRWCKGKMVLERLKFEDIGLGESEDEPPAELQEFMGVSAQAEAIPIEGTSPAEVHTSSRISTRIQGIGKCLRNANLYCKEFVEGLDKYVDTLPHIAKAGVLFAIWIMKGLLEQGVEEFDYSEKFLVECMKSMGTVDVPANTVLANLSQYLYEPTGTLATFILPLRQKYINEIKPEAFASLDDIVDLGLNPLAKEYLTNQYNLTIQNISKCLDVIVRKMFEDQRPAKQYYTPFVQHTKLNILTGSADLPTKDFMYGGKPCILPDPVVDNINVQIARFKAEHMDGYEEKDLDANRWTMICRVTQLQKLAANAKSIEIGEERLRKQLEAMMVLSVNMAIDAPSLVTLREYLSNGSYQNRFAHVFAKAMFGLSAEDGTTGALVSAVQSAKTFLHIHVGSLSPSASSSSASSPPTVPANILLLVDNLATQTVRPLLDRHGVDVCRLLDTTKVLQLAAAVALAAERSGKLIIDRTKEDKAARRKQSKLLRKVAEEARAKEVAKASKPGKKGGIQVASEGGGGVAGQGEGGVDRMDVDPPPNAAQPTVPPPRPLRKPPKPRIETLPDRVKLAPIRLGIAHVLPLLDLSLRHRPSVAQELTVRDLRRTLDLKNPPLKPKKQGVETVIAGLSQAVRDAVAERLATVASITTRSFTEKGFAGPHFPDNLADSLDVRAQYEAVVEQLNIRKNIATRTAKTKQLTKEKENRASTSHFPTTPFQKLHCHARQLAMYVVRGVLQSVRLEGPEFAKNLAKDRRRPEESQEQVDKRHAALEQRTVQCCTDAVLHSLRHGLSILKLPSNLRMAQPHLPHARKVALSEKYKVVARCFGGRKLTGEDGGLSEEEYARIFSALRATFSTFKWTERQAPVKEDDKVKDNSVDMSGEEVKEKVEKTAEEDKKAAEEVVEAARKKSYDSFANMTIFPEPSFSSRPAPIYGVIFHQILVKFVPLYSDLSYAKFKANKRTLWDWFFRPWTIEGPSNSGETWTLRSIMLSKARVFAPFRRTRETTAARQDVAGIAGGGSKPDPEDVKFDFPSPTHTQAPFCFDTTSDCPHATDHKSHFPSNRVLLQATLDSGVRHYFLDPNVGQPFVAMALEPYVEVRLLTDQEKEKLKTMPWVRKGQGEGGVAGKTTMWGTESDWGYFHHQNKDQMLDPRVVEIRTSVTNKGVRDECGFNMERWSSNILRKNVVLGNQSSLDHWVGKLESGELRPSKPFKPDPNAPGLGGQTVSDWESKIPAHRNLDLSHYETYLRYVVPRLHDITHFYNHPYFHHSKFRTYRKKLQARTRIISNFFGNPNKDLFKTGTVKQVQVHIGDAKFGVSRRGHAPSSAMIFRDIMLNMRDIAVDGELKVRGGEVRLVEDPELGGVLGGEYRPPPRKERKVDWT